MKKMLVCLLALLVLAVGAACAEGMFEIDETEANTCGITGYTGPGGEVVIPDTINGLPVEFIGWEAFAGNHGITSVIIPESVLNIQDRAFYGCDYLEKVQLPETLSSIASQAFAYCFALKEIDLPAGVLYIGPEAFDGCNQLVLSAEDLALYQAGGAMQMSAPFTGERTDLAEWLGGSLPEFNEAVGPMDKSSESYTIMEGAYFVGEGVRSYTYDEQIVEEIHLRGDSGYSILGVYVGMSAEEAIAAAKAEGFAVDRETSGHFPLIHNCDHPQTGNSLRIFEDSEGKVQEIQYIRPW